MPVGFIPLQRTSIKRTSHVIYKTPIRKNIVQTFFGYSFTRLTIFSRLILVNLTVLVMALGVSVYAIVQIDHMNKISHRIIQVHNVLIDLNQEMTNALLTENRYEKKFTIIQDQALYDGFITSKTDFEKYLNEAMALPNSIKVNDALMRIRKLNQDYTALFEKEVALMQAGKRSSRNWFNREKEKVMNEEMDELAELKSLSQQSVLKNITQLDEKGVSARTVAMVITWTTLLLGFALSIWTARSIALPLSLMKKKAEDIAGGVFNADLDLTSPPEVGALADAFNTMCFRLKELDRMKSDFYSLMSHELRTPLTSIREGTNMFLEGLGGEITEKQRDLLIIIAEESSRLIDLVSRLLDLSKLEAGVLALNFSMTDLPPLIVQSIREVTPLAAAKNIRIECDIKEIPPVSVESERILQVLRNLIGNALKFTPTGGVVRVAAHRMGGEVSVSVTDTGLGIPKEELNVIFDKFRQASPASSSRFPGTGLGLAIVKHVIQAHGGRVWAESELGHGSTFTFVLPALSS